MTAPLVLDSVTHLTAEARGRIAVCASHGAVYAAWYGARKGVSALILNDAGIGREQAGISGLEFLDGLGVPAATVAHTSARIGWGADMPARGVLSFVNAAAASSACAPAWPAPPRSTSWRAPTSRPRRNRAPGGGPPRDRRGRQTGRSRLRARFQRADRPEDAGHVVVTASHGGLLGGRPETAVKAQVLAGIYVDADRGLDDAGLSRLPALQDRGIAGATVSAFSARIGDGLSVWEDGFISALNPEAARRGGMIGQSTRDFVAAMVASAT